MMSVREAIAAAERQVPGRFIGMRGEERRGDRTFYVFAWSMPDGRVVNVLVNAVTGQASVQ
jgi:uncharacterized membrane protein YkoI